MFHWSHFPLPVFIYPPRAFVSVLSSVAFVSPSFHVRKNNISVLNVVSNIAAQSALWGNIMSSLTISDIIKIERDDAGVGRRDREGELLQYYLV